ncbi:hypothetical protein Gorai_018225, partial [Gossypium raimondii]|nr:hypothetical protein [Gossypium raimondii]
SNDNWNIEESAETNIIVLTYVRSVWKGNGQEKSMEKQKFGKQEHQKLAAQWAKLLDSEKEPFKQKTVMEKVENEKIKRELECENEGLAYTVQSYMFAKVVQGL